MIPFPFYPKEVGMEYLISRSLRKMTFPLVAVLFCALMFGVPFGTPVAKAGEGHPAEEGASEDSSQLTWQEKLKEQLDR